ncbi:hypothetical protein [Diaphorobacter caeni]|uniref:hypothetical protein n=1 Tax=Diaphorobacter caeni TaxID=2784387 RepID=UPI00188DC983|nr:hypothetical protein [Diaphorobacter caeni]MBF5004551.1 hypothetical protein [Diaphorobacter caeni]
MMLPSVQRSVLCGGLLLVSLLPFRAFAAGATVESPSPLAGWTLGYAPYTYHFSDAKKEHDFEPDDEKHKYVWLVTAEKQFGERNVAGLALFSNSFGQFSQYAYYGWMFRPFDSTQQFYVKLTGGVIHGYKYPYNKKIPLNNKSGWGVTVIPAVGWDFSSHWGAQLNLLGNSGLMFQANYTFR